ncbi:growth hormone secretagogue receptor type 1-like [Ciona intestinalis]
MYVCLYLLNHYVIIYRPYRQPFNQVAIAICASILVPLTVFGLAANTVTIIVIAKSPKLRSIFNFMILSLCVSDFLSALLSPLFLYRRTWGFEDWQISSFLCKVFWAGDVWTSYVTSTHILMFALLRFVSIQSQAAYYKIKIIHIKIIITVIWIITFLIGFVPFSIWFGSKKRDRYSNTIDAKWPACTLNLPWLRMFQSYTVIAYSLLFYIPMILVIILSFCIGFVLFRKRKNRQAIISEFLSSRSPGEKIGDTVETKRRRKENQVILQLALIVGSYLLGYIPHTAYQFYTTSVKPTTHYAKAFDWWFGMIEHMALRISECLNPVFYNLASSKMRSETVRVLKSFWRCVLSPCRPELVMQSTRTVTSIPVSTGFPENQEIQRAEP